MDYMETKETCHLCKTTLSTIYMTVVGDVWECRSPIACVERSTKRQNQQKKARKEQENAANTVASGILLKHSEMNGPLFQFCKFCGEDTPFPCDAAYMAQFYVQIHGEMR